MFKITLGIDGMSCSMCEAHVNDVIRKNFKDVKVSSSASRGTTSIISSEKIDESELRDILNPTGYKVTSYKIEDYVKRKLFGLF